MPETDMLTIADFIERYSITADVAPATSNPNMSDSEYMTHHFLVTLHHGCRDLAVPYSGGALAFANRPDGQPTVADVLDSLASDASSAGQSFTDWCGDYGYDEDSRKAYRTWQAVEAQQAELRDFLGADALTVLIYGTERA